MKIVGSLMQFWLWGGKDGLGSINLWVYSIELMFSALGLDEVTNKVKRIESDGKRNDSYGIPMVQF